MRHFAPWLENVAKLSELSYWISEVLYHVVRKNSVEPCRNMLTVRYDVRVG